MSYKFQNKGLFMNRVIYIYNQQQFLQASSHTSLFFLTISALLII
jgi:hypothetical protein